MLHATSWQPTNTTCPFPMIQPRLKISHPADNPSSPSLSNKSKPSSLFYHSTQPTKLTAKKQPWHQSAKNNRIILLQLRGKNSIYMKNWMEPLATEKETAADTCTAQPANHLPPRMINDMHRYYHHSPTVLPLLPLPTATLSLAAHVMSIPLCLEHLEITSTPLYLYLPICAALPTKRSPR